MKHVCRKGGGPITSLEGPAWAAPGSLVKFMDQEDWGKVEMVWRCCHTYEVRVEEVGDQECGLRVVGPDDLENPYAAYPSNLPPLGYPVPKGLLRR